MVSAHSEGEWVAFAEEDDVGNARIELIAQSKVEPIRVGPNRHEYHRNFNKSDASTASSWMQKPINTNASWAPVVPPESREPLNASRRHRPPRNPASSPRHVQPVNGPHPVVSSSSDSSSDGLPTRGRAAAPSPTSRRGRSTSRARQVVAPRPSSRARSSSRSRQTSNHRGRSSSAQHRAGNGDPTMISRRRSRSTSRTRLQTVTIQPRQIQRHSANRPPPSTSRTRGFMKTNGSSSASAGPGLPRASNPMSPSGSQRRFLDDNASFKSFDVNIGRDISFGRTKSSRSLSGQNNGHSGGNIVVTTNQPDPIHPRILLTATVYHNTATNLWIATINTNQKGVSKNPATASKYLKAFSFATEREARESAIANAPPKMLPFSENPNCFVCNTKFSMFKRASHCRNCGVCICSSCTVTWSSKMIPETYNLKKEKHVKVCKSCNAMSLSFKKALLTGDYEEAIALYGSGNVNLRVPFPPTKSKKEEILHPIHCAVQGGNINIVTWLIEDHFCPIKRVVRSSKNLKGGKSDLLIRTSKDRTVLSIAMSTINVEILRYLVVDCKVSVLEASNLRSALRSLEAALHVLPPPDNNTFKIHDDSAVHRWDTSSFKSCDGDMSVASSLGADGMSRADDMTLGSKRKGEACILCSERSIDCVMTPCGHQVCCLQCSSSLQSCPVCNTRGNFIKIFRP